VDTGVVPSPKPIAPAPTRTFAADSPRSSVSSERVADISEGRPMGPPPPQLGGAYSSTSRGSSVLKPPAMPRISSGSGIASEESAIDKPAMVSDPETKVEVKPGSGVEEENVLPSGFRLTDEHHFLERNPYTMVDEEGTAHKVPKEELFSRHQHHVYPDRKTASEAMNHYHGKASDIMDQINEAHKLVYEAYSEPSPEIKDFIDPQTNSIDLDRYNESAKQRESKISKVKAARDAQVEKLEDKYKHFTNAKDAAWDWWAAQTAFENEYDYKPEEKKKILDDYYEKLNKEREEAKFKRQVPAIGQWAQESEEALFDHYRGPKGFGILIKADLSSDSSLVRGVFPKSCLEGTKL
jgi:hypothetical protein